MPNLNPYFIFLVYAATSPDETKLCSLGRGPDAMKFPFQNLYLTIMLEAFKLVL